jgi:hypothetical protein
MRVRAPVTQSRLLPLGSEKLDLLGRHTAPSAGIHQPPLFKNLSRHVFISSSSWPSPWLSFAGARGF